MKTIEEIKKLGENLRIKIREGNEEATEYEIDCIVKGFILGYSGCQQDNADKKYTEEDLKKAYHRMETKFKSEPFEDFIQSLSKR